jgi:uncharacterized protein HemX
MNADPAVIGGQAGVVLAVLFVFVVICVGAITAYAWITSNSKAEWSKALAEHEEREDKKSKERHEEIVRLIASLQERVDRLYERPACG